MPDINSVIRRFAGFEFLIRRMYATDPEFKIVCDDYADALRASEVWAKNEVISKDYCQLVRELEAEIVQYMESKRPVKDRMHGGM